MMTLNTHRTMKMCDMHATHSTHTQDSDGNFERVVEVLDEDDGAGWDFLSALLRGEASALQLSQHPFLSPFNS